MKANSPIILYLERNNLIDEFISYGTYMRYVAGISYFNAATLIAQRHGVGFAATETTWQKRFGRKIKPGANPLVIMKPFAPLDLYFEACDTYSPEGDALPEWIAENAISIPHVPQKPFALAHNPLIRLLNNHGVYYDESDMGERTDGLMRYCESPIRVEAYHNKAYEKVHTHYAMIVNAKKSSIEKATTIFHEIGHLLCGHLPQDEELKKISWMKLSIPKRDIPSLSTRQQEYEAETACMLIMKGLGYEYDRSKYLDSYMINGQAPEYDMGMSIAAADQFLNWMLADPELRHYIPNWV